MTLELGPDSVLIFWKEEFLSKATFWAFFVESTAVWRMPIFDLRSVSYLSYLVFC